VDTFKDRHLDTLKKELGTGDFDRVVHTTETRPAPSNVDLNDLDFDIDDLLDTLTSK
jgi:hypothetical protein